MTFPAPVSIDERASQLTVSLSDEGYYATLHYQGKYNPKESKGGWFCMLLNNAIKGIPSGRAATPSEAICAAADNLTEMMNCGIYNK